MKYKNVNLEWNVLYIEPNSKLVKKFNTTILIDMLITTIGKGLNVRC